MNGRLSDQPLAELVQEISDAQLSGALRLARERVKAAVYFDGGRVVAALSNVRAFRLVELLRRAGSVNPSRLYAAVGEASSDEQAAAALVGAGVLDEAALNQLRERQSREVLAEALRWTEGEWSFDPRVRLAGTQQQAAVEPAALLLESARALPAELVAARTRDDEPVAPAAGVQERMTSGLRLLPSEAFVLSRLDAPLRLGEVVAVAGLPEEETRKTVYALALAGLLERPERPRAFSEDDLRAARRPVAAPAAAAQQEAAAQEAARKTAESAPEPEAPATVEELYALARGATHYEVLGVTRTAPPEEVKRVYYSYARRLHPDRFRRDADEQTRQRVDAAFARVTQAYETLKDPKLRAAYDLKLSKQRGG
ncbi:MAG TPA: DUF4388 domain-containing protein [Pyrinomonadaceae bacterium]|jgi:hypothetical protein